MIKYMIIQHKQKEVQYMDEPKTVGGVGTDLLVEQTRDVSAMRDTLISFNKTDPNAVRKAMQNVTLLRVYHQLERIVRYTDLIDRIEDSIYQSIDAKLDSSDPSDPELYFSLIPIQERLQRMMVESHKLLEPYLNMEQLATFDVPVAEDPSQAFASMILDQESREKVRTSAQELLAAISALDGTSVDAESKEAVKSKAAEALAQIEDNSEDEE